MTDFGKFPSNIKGRCGFAYTTLVIEKYDFLNHDI